MDNQYFKDRFNTPLSSMQQVEYDRWISRMEKGGGRPNIKNDVEDYDLQGFWKSGGRFESSEEHGFDRFKKPNHPTFSDESQYSGITDPVLGKVKGGTWSGSEEAGWKFSPSSEMLDKTHSIEDMSAYFRLMEPNAQLLPLKKPIVLTPPSFGRSQVNSPAMKAR